VKALIDLIQSTYLNRIIRESVRLMRSTPKAGRVII
jgi:hypothetical protein